ncbi:hypothetical protein K8I61_03080 [bacterium]|nr:hypothetical protein [bacterium]
MAFDKFRWIVVAALIIATAGLGCRLEGEDEDDVELPSAGYNTFRLMVDDVGPVPEIDATGLRTGRRGFTFDRDLDGVGDTFYQLLRPSGGIIAIAFGEDGFATGGKAFAMAKFVAGQTHYEIPIETLTRWVRFGSAIGYREGRYIDEPNTLVYMDRVNGVEAEAKLTGNRRTVEHQLVTMGTVAPGQGKSAPVVEEPAWAALPAGESHEPFAIDPRCTDYTKFCEALADTGSHAEGFADTGMPWSVTACAQNMYNHQDGGAGSRYNSCLTTECAGENTADGIESCVLDCRRQTVIAEDAYGCGNQYAPAFDDVIYLVERGGQRFQFDSGVSVTGNDRLSFFFDYKDAECAFNAFDENDPDTFHIGRVTVTFTEGATGTFTFTPKPNFTLGCNSFEDGKMLGFTFDELIDGDYEFTVQLTNIAIERGRLGAMDFGSMTQGEWEDAVDDFVDRSACVKRGVPYTGTFSVDGHEGGQQGRTNVSSLEMDFFEVYEDAINPFNIGKGFIDPKTVERESYFFEFEDFGLAILQGYIWGTIGIETFGEWSIDELNSNIFTTTENTRKTKFDDTDDVQAFAFYMDQPLSSGLFTLWGDAGWNIYSKGPANSNDSQPFVRENFDDVEIYMPFSPLSADNEFNGCEFDPSWWADYLTDPLPLGLNQDTIEGFTRDEFAQNLQRYSGTTWAQCRIACLRARQSARNGCFEWDDCFETCPAEPDAARQVCDLPGNPPLSLNVSVTVPEEFLSNPDFAAVLSPDPEAVANGEAEPLRVGLIGIGSDNQFHSVPGGWVPFQLGKTEYEVPLPYFPYTPPRFLIISAMMGSNQAQMYVGLLDKDDNPFGTASYPPDGAHTEDWSHLVLWANNWVQPVLEGWSLSVVEGNSITDFVDPFETTVGVTFGELTPLQMDDLTP